MTRHQHHRSLVARTAGLSTNLPAPRRLLALLTVALIVSLPVLVLPVLAGPASTPSADAAPAATTLALTNITPVSVRPGKTLRVSGRFTTAAQLTDVNVRLEIGYTPFGSRNELTEAAATLPSTVPVPGADEQLGKVRAGSSRSFRISIRANDLALPVAAGVFPLRISVTAGANAEILNQTTTFLPWVPKDKERADTRMLFFWPLIDVPRQDATGAITVPGLGAELDPGGRLQTLTSAGQDAPVTWIMDPALLSAVAALDTDSARAWLQGLPAAIGTNEPAIVPFGDPDLAAVSAADRLQVLREGLFRGEDIAETALSPLEVRTDVGWPADGAADALTINRAHRVGNDFLLLSEQTAPVTGALSYTPSGRMDDESGAHLLLADSTASALVASPARNNNDVMLSRQRFLAETLLHDLELPNDARLMVIVPPRRWNPNPAWATTLVEATQKASWLNPVTLDEAVQPSAPTVERLEPTIPETSAERQLPVDMVVDAANAMPQARKFRAILTHPATLARPIEDALLTSLGTAWRADHVAAEESLQLTLDRLQAQTGRVRIVSRGGTLSDDRGLLPVSIRNQLDQAVVVRLGVESTDPLRLQAEVPDQRIKIAAEGSETLSIQLDAVTSGRLTVDAQILTPHGHQYSEPVRLPVDVRAYGHVALIVFGAAAALMVLAAMVRIGRRIKASRRPAS